MLILCNDSPILSIILLKTNTPDASFHQSSLPKQDKYHPSQNQPLQLQKERNLVDKAWTPNTQKSNIYIRTQISLIEWSSKKRR